MEILIRSFLESILQFFLRPFGAVGLNDTVSRLSKNEIRKHLYSL